MSTIIKRKLHLTTKEKIPSFNYTFSPKIVEDLKTEGRRINKGDLVEFDIYRGHGVRAINIIVSLTKTSHLWYVLETYA